MKLYRMSDPNGIRTRATAVKGRRPRPLNDGAEASLSGHFLPTLKHKGCVEENANRGRALPEDRGCGRTMGQSHLCLDDVMPK
jgi:hypothetical protein